MTHRTITIGERNIELLSVLGQGGYGSVYLIDIEGNKKAIKIITRPGKEGISLREIDIMSKLVHPNLIRAEGLIVGIDKSLPEVPQVVLPNLPPLLSPTRSIGKVKVGIIMPLARTDLQRLMRLPAFTFQQRLKILYDVTSGLKYMHDTNYLHLDLKPMNVLIFGDGNNITGRLTDFGISLILENSINKYFPVELVTITHRSPEILGGSRV